MLKFAAASALVEARARAAMPPAMPRSKLSDAITGVAANTVDASVTSPISTLSRIPIIGLPICPLSRVT